MTLTVHYTVTDSLLQAEFVATGQPQFASRALTLDTTALPPAALQALVVIAKAHTGRSTRIFHLGAYRFDPVLPSSLVQDQPEFDHEPTLAEVTAALLVMAETYPPAHAAMTAFARQRQEERRLAQENQRANEEAARLAKIERDEQRAADKQAWAAEHGSDHLRRALAARYDCQRLYVTERAALEFPGFAVDFADTADWNERACPSLPALDLLDQLSTATAPAGLAAEAVWLIDDGWRDRDGMARENEYDACEAIVIRNYLGKYNLLRVL